MPYTDDLKSRILEEAHGDCYRSILLGWPKKGCCTVCRKVSQFPTSEGRAPKAEWFTTRNPNPTLKWEDVNMDFVVGFPRTR